MDDESDFKFADLEQFYVFFHANREANTHIKFNMHDTVTRLQFSNSGVSPRAIQHFQRTTSKTPSDVRLFLYQKDDFRYRYWSRRLQQLQNV